MVHAGFLLKAKVVFEESEVRTSRPSI